MGDDIPDKMSFHDLFVLVQQAFSLPPVVFNYQARGCVGELVATEGRINSLSSPSYPDVFTGPLVCKWTSRSPILIRVTYLDLDQELDVLTLSDLQHNTSLTGSQFPRYVLLDSPATITFLGRSIGMRKGFSLDYEVVESHDEWNVNEGRPAVILGRPGSQEKPSAWRARGPAGVRGLTVLVWASYIPSDDSECTSHFLQVAGGADEGVKICGGTGMRVVHVIGDEVIMVLHSSSPMAVLVATVHVMK